MAARRQDGRLEGRRVHAPADEERQALLDGAQAERLDALDFLAAPSISSVEPPPMSITRRRSPGMASELATPM
jgi:hypothetical protein